MKYQKLISIFSIVLLTANFLYADTVLQGLPCSLVNSNGAMTIDQPSTDPACGFQLPMGQGSQFCYLPDQDQGIHYLGFALDGGVSLGNVDLTDVQVYADGNLVQQDLVSMAHSYYGDMGLHVAFLFDQSWALSDVMLQLKLCAGQVIDQLAPEDMIYLSSANYESSPTPFVNWRTVGDDVQQVKNDIDSGVKTCRKDVMSLNDITSVRIYDAMNSLIDSYPDITDDQKLVQRKVLIVFSTLEDDASSVTFEAVKNKAIEKNIKVIIFTPEGKNYNESHADLISSNTGGAIWQPDYNKTDYRPQFETLTAPHLGLVVTVPADLCPGDGLTHNFAIVINEPEIGETQVSTSFQTAIFTAKSFWERILSISVPAFLALIIIAGLLIAGIQLRGRKSASVSGQNLPEVDPGMNDTAQTEGYGIR